MAKAYKCDRCKRYFDERGKNYNEVVDGEYDVIALYNKFISVRLDAKRCDRCGEFYARKELKRDNAIDILGKKVFNVVLKYRGESCDHDYLVDLCPKCMNELKWFFENAKI